MVGCMRTSLPEPEYDGVIDVTLVPDLRVALAPFGLASVVDGFDPLLVGEEELMGRLVELGPGIDADDAAVKSAYAARVAVASRLGNPAHQTSVLAPLRAAAFDPESPRRMAALKALAEVDEAAATMLRLECERELASRARETRVGFATCMGTH